MKNIRPRYNFTVFGYAKYDDIGNLYEQTAKKRRAAAGSACLLYKKLRYAGNI